MKQSAGILLYKFINEEIFVLLVHPGGPFWKNKDLGTWSIPKGEFVEPENALDAAIREFREETGTKLNGGFIALAPVKLKSGKLIFAWACQQDLEAGSIKSNAFEIEWPPKSGNLKSFPEIDKAAWFATELAFQKINPAQTGFIRELISII
jgi:predicted NUDIX family NTP pyrophosphohydrolase